MYQLLQIYTSSFFFPAKRSHLRYTKKKIPPTRKTIVAVKSQKIYKMEYEFYRFAVDVFENNLKRMMDSKGEEFLPTQFHYEKIKPIAVGN